MVMHMFTPADVFAGDMTGSMDTSGLGDTRVDLMYNVKRYASDEYEWAYAGTICDATGLRYHRSYSISTSSKYKGRVMA